MLQIRRNCFETNSSSTHSLVMCDDNIYKALENNEAFLIGYMHGDQDVVRKEDLFTYLREHKSYLEKNWRDYCKETGLNPESVDDFANEIIAGFNKANTMLDYEIYTLDQFDDKCEMETYYQTYKTKDGEIIHAFGCFGYDG